MKTKITPVDSLRMAHLKKISGTPDRADKRILRGRPMSYNWAGYQKLQRPGVGWIG
ncbi:MAG: hypothetical protein O6927_09705 [Gammaproteobacteria bacterium]|nr:hypothetical protein [Gammaproteobacteria bacterium]